ERGFSTSGNILPRNTAMSLETLNARLNIIDGLRRFDGKLELVPITKDMLLTAKSSRQKYEVHLVKERELLLAKQQKQKALDEHRCNSENFKAAQRKRRHIETME